MAMKKGKARARALVCMYTGGRLRHALERDDKVLLPLQQLLPSNEDITHHLSFLCSSTQWPTTTLTSASGLATARHPYATLAIDPEANYAKIAAANIRLRKPSLMAVGHRQGGNFSGRKTQTYAWQAPLPPENWGRKPDVQRRGIVQSRQRFPNGIHSSGNEINTRLNEKVKTTGPRHGCTCHHCVREDSDCSMEPSESGGRNVTRTTQVSRQRIRSTS